MSKRLGATWWREAIARMRAPFGPRAAKGFALLGGAAGALGIPGCFDEFPAPAEPTQAAADAETDAHTVAAIDLQRAKGWNALADQPLELEGALAVDVDGRDGWRDGATLAAALAPSRSELAPFYVPTLMQALAGPDGASLRAAMSPVLTMEMNRAYAKGRALRSLFEQAGPPRETADTAVVLDLPGAESVAVSAALADRLDPVYVFDNWPHPAGVVPSQQTLGAALYYRPLLERLRAARTSSAAPLFVLDADRSAAYEDDATQFDNRYLAKVPTAQRLAALGVRHLLYVVPSAEQTHEQDDLNEAFLEYQSAGIDVKLLAMSDFEEDVTDPLDPEEQPPSNLTLAVYFWGGSPLAHACFWDHYHWHAPVHPNHVALPVPSRVARGFDFRVAQRPTMSVHTPGIGRVTFRVGRATGSFVGVGRSGSFGRFHGGFSS